MVQSQETFITETSAVEDVVTIAAVNFKSTWGNKEDNFNRIKGYTKAAAKRGANIIIFPEMALTGYDLDTENNGNSRMQIVQAETIPGPSTNSLASIASEYGVYIVIGMPEKGNNSMVYNSAAIIGPNGVISSYQKIQPFGDENSWCEKGRSPLIINTEWGPVGIGICYDTYQFPELLRYYAAKGARLYINITAQHEDPMENTGKASFEQYYMPTLTSAVIANEIFVASANLVGMDKVTYFGGSSMILGPGIRQTTSISDPMYHIYAGSKNDKQQGLVMATVDLSKAVRSIYKNNAVTGKPDFRPDLYVKWYGELAQ